MKKLLKLKKTSTEEVEMEVEFPIFREHDVSGDTHSRVVYMRIDPDKEVSITKTERYDGTEITQWEIEVERTRLEGQNVDWALGRAGYKSSEERFNSALTALRKFVAEL